MSILLSLWRLLDRQQRRQLLGLQLLSIVMGLSTVGGIAAVLPFFTALADPSAIGRNGVVRLLLPRGLAVDDGTLLIALGVGFCLVVLLANAVNLFGVLAINRFAFRVGDALYRRLFNEYLHRDFGFHSRNNSSVLASKVLHETARVTSGVLQQGLILVSNLVTICCIGASMMFLNPVAAAGALVGLGGSYVLIYVLARGRLLRNGEIESRADAERVRTVTEGFGAIRELTLMQARASFVQRFAEHCRVLSTTTANTLAISQSPRYVLECITVVSLVAVALHLHGHARVGSPWIAQLSFVAFAAYRLLPALQQSFAAIVRIRAERPAFRDVQSELTPAAREPRAPATGPERSWYGRPREEIRVHEVSFRYAPERPDAVSAASFAIRAGTLVGFVGVNGSGKTTLLDLVSGLLTPQSGHIEIDGVRLDRGNCAAWQSTIAYVPQQVFLFDATLAENIACGVPVAAIDPARLETAARLARLEECVASLPGGYDEVIGERGCRLSGGQRQRLAIARALYRDASVLILDEVTSSLDGTAENEILETLRALRPARTVLMIAHRAGALRHCEVVFELRNGELAAASGSASGSQPAQSVARFSVRC
ncbi:MAG TPA: ABC transporter ATP-binding protein [Steroidobacteraceae bacterium]|nr:ABC transporter ATP-binding protein [Steroidobacteraceae bacterium]